MSVTNTDLKILAQHFGGKFYGPNIEHLKISEENFFELSKAIYQLALEHCKQGEAKAYIIHFKKAEIRAVHLIENESQHPKNIGFGDDVQVDLLFAHAMPKSEGKRVFEFIIPDWLPKGSEDMFADCNTWRPTSEEIEESKEVNEAIRECEAGDFVDHMSVIDAVLDMVKNKIVSLQTNQPLFTTPQPSTDVSELIDAMNEVIRISDRDHDAWNKVKALIAKHTVK